LQFKAICVCADPPPIDVDDFTNHPAKGYEQDIVFGDRLADLRSYDIVIAYNGSHHYSPTVPLSNVDLPNWALRKVLVAVEEAKKYSVMAGDECLAMQQNMHEFHQSIVQATQQFVLPWADRPEGSQGPRVVPQAATAAIANPPPPRQKIILPDGTIDPNYKPPASKKVHIDVSL